MKNTKSALNQRRELRRKMTITEKIVWERLRTRNLNGIKFKRQFGIGPYILDFFAPSINLAIEIDGGIHERPDVREKDQNKYAFT